MCLVLTPPESDELELLAGKFDLSKNDFEEPSRPTTLKTYQKSKSESDSYSDKKSSMAENDKLVKIRRKHHNHA